MVRHIPILLLVLAAFAAGFFTHRQAWHDYPRLAAAALVGDLGGCDLSGALSIFQQRERPDLMASLARNSQVLEQTPDGLRHWHTPLGNFWSPRSTRVFLVLAEQAHRVYGDGPYRVRANDTVLDCGANIGAFTREALSAGAAKVIAIEPVPENLESLRRTFAREIEAGRVVLVPKGVWHREETLTMFVYPDTILNSFVKPNETEAAAPATVSLPVTTIDKLVQELQLQKVDFIKMDIEGAERSALVGARETISRFRPRMSIALEHNDDDFQAVPKLVDSIAPGYKRKCGDCNRPGFLTVRPGVLYLTP